MPIYNLREDDFDRVIELGNKIGGKDYLNHAALGKIHRLGCRVGLSCSFVAYKGRREEKELMGFRLAMAPGSWVIDDWCSPYLWGVDPKKVCYLKTNMVDAEYRGQGLGTLLLQKSIEVAKNQGAVAGVAHIWKQSPGNSAFRYFTKAGGQLVMLHPNRWNSVPAGFGRSCIVCGKDCHCDAIEMILYF